MKFLTAFIVLLSLPVLAVETGSLAPDFTLRGIVQKKDYKLSELKGKIVVLEWFNHGCPFVKKHYSVGNMQALQKKYTQKNVIWLSINSSAPGKQGHLNAEGAMEERKIHSSHSTDILLDPTGTVGKLFEAKTTPHMYIIDRTGKLVYQGAIDDHPDTNPSSIPGSKNFVAQALDEQLEGKSISVPTTKAYGCSVKY
jgi:peroxiredoxin